jgi:hypothetical protein
MGMSWYLKTDNLGLGLLIMVLKAGLTSTGVMLPARLLNKAITSNIMAK